MANRESTLGELCWNRWFETNNRKGRHIEVYNQEALENLMLSRLQKMVNEINSGKRKTLGRLPRVSDVDAVFQEILDAGLLAPEHPKDDAAEKAEAERKAAEDAEIQAAVQLQLLVDRLERTGGHRAVSTWLHTKATAAQKKLFVEEFGTGATTPEAAPHQAANLFLVRATLPDGRIKFVSGEVSPVPLDSTAAHHFGRTNAQRFADLLAKQRPELKKIEIVPLTQTERAPEFDAEKSAVNFMREFYPNYIPY